MAGFIRAIDKTNYGEPYILLEGASYTFTECLMSKSEELNASKLHNGEKIIIEGTNLGIKNGKIVILKSCKIVGSWNKKGAGLYIDDKNFDADKEQVINITSGTDNSFTDYLGGIFSTLLFVEADVLDQILNLSLKNELNKGDQLKIFYRVEPNLSDKKVVITKLIITPATGKRVSIFHNENGKYEFSN